MTSQPIIDNPFRLVQLLEFKVAFPTEEPKSVEEYLKGGNRDIILNAAAFFLGFNNQKSKYDDPKEALKMFFRTENQSFANLIYSKIKALEKPVRIFNIYSNLKLFEIFFSMEEQVETQFDAEFEVNLFKALLVLNSEYTLKQSLAFSSTRKVSDDLRFPMLLLCMSLPVSDKINYNINVLWVSQFMKAMNLFQFLEREPRTQQLLSDFLKRFNCSSWKEYLIRLLPLTFSVIRKENEAHIDIPIKPGKDFEGDCGFLEKLSVHTEDEMAESDFLTLRSKPFYKISEGVYRIIFGLFVVEKIFKGAYFILSEINNSLPKKDKILDLKSLFGEEFSEKVLCYKIFREIYPNHCISISGKEFTDRKIDGAPDYYVRKGKNILLIESKDFLIPARIKDSFDFDQYASEFEKKLYFTEVKGIKKPKAVLQLINNIKIILKNELQLDTDYKYREVTIYPILLIHDHQFDVEGFNHLINYWFQKELEFLHEEGYFINRIKPLVVVNIDYLIHHQETLRKKMSFHEVLDLYVEHIRVQPFLKFRSEQEMNNYQTSKMITFSTFMDNYFVKRGWKDMPPEFLELGHSLFDDQS